MVKHIQINSKKYPGAYASVDDSDYDLISGFSWYANKSRRGRTLYAVRFEIIEGLRRQISMHRMLLSVPDGMVTDHIDGNGLNNCRNNLRAVSQAVNMRAARQRLGDDYKKSTRRTHDISAHKRTRADGSVVIYYYDRKEKRRLTDEEVIERTLPGKGARWAAEKTADTVVHNSGGKHASA